MTGTILAIDLGKFHSVACFYEVADGRHEFKRIESSPRAMSDLLAERKVSKVVIEISGQSGWVVDSCRALGVEVEVANVNSEPWRWRNLKNKCDRSDALKLARLSVMGQLSLVAVPMKEVRQWRSLIQYRHRLVERRVAIGNSIHALLTASGGAVVIARWNRQMVSELRKESRRLEDCARGELWRGQLDLELDAMEQLEQLIERVEEKLDALVADEQEQWGERVALLKTIPGVGPRLAEMVVAWIDDPNRFASGRQVGAYAGLTPRRYQSGQSDRSGGISKAGSGRLRKLLVQVAWGMVRYNPRGGEVFQRLCKGHKTRRKQAVVALARKVLVWCWAMLRDGRPWREDHRPAPVLVEAGLV